MVIINNYCYIELVDLISKCFILEIILFDNFNELSEFCSKILLNLSDSIKFLYGLCIMLVNPDLMLPNEA